MKKFDSLDYCGYTCSDIDASFVEAEEDIKYQLNKLLGLVKKQGTEKLRNAFDEALRDAERELEDKNDEIEQLEEKISKYEDDIEYLKDQIAELEKRLKDDY